jgi:hypothetical protein
VKPTGVYESQSWDQTKELAVARIAHAALVMLLTVAALCAVGCVHTWTETYHEYPPAAWEIGRVPPQGDPNDG